MLYLKSYKMEFLIELIIKEVFFFKKKSREFTVKNTNVGRYSDQGPRFSTIDIHSLQPIILPSEHLILNLCIKLFVSGCLYIFFI